jgi:FAD dependent oxidoreductase TIGR03364
MGVEFRWNTPVTAVEMPRLRLGGGGVIEAERVYVCSGTDLEQLYPATYASVGIRKCKLQMLAAQAPEDGMRLGPMIASGLTLRHYDNFAVCPSLPALKTRVAREQPLLDRFGIHVMASQHMSGEFILGDSHEYDADITPFGNAAIDDMIVEELQRFIELPSWRITRRWDGLYAKLSGRPAFWASPEAGVTVVTATGGSGMTMALGLAEMMWKEQA